MFFFGSFCVIFSKMETYIFCLNIHNLYWLLEKTTSQTKNPCILERREVPPSDNCLWTSSLAS